MKVSIIIPVFNVENYVKRTLNSIINQSYKNIEILVINDGSNDNTYSICKEFDKYENFKLINKKNGGVSSARNIGLKYASGDAILFIDGDDYLELNMVEELVNDMKKNNSDISICNYYIRYNDFSEIGINNLLDRSVFNRNDFYLNMLSSDSFQGFLWNKLISASLIKNIEFDEESRILEDMLFLSSIKAEKLNVSYINKPLYNYIQRSTSALHTINKNKFKNEIETFEKIMLNIKSIDVNLYDSLEVEYIIKVKTFLNNISCDIEEKSYYEKKCKSIYKFKMYFSSISIKQKIKLFVLMHCAVIYKFFKKRGDN